MTILTLPALLLGLVVGSFLNVVIHRVPAGLSVVRPGSHCPSCDAAIRARHNVPVLGWLMLRGRCADCAAPISARYPLVELGTGLLFAAVTGHAQRLGLLAALPAFLAFAAAAVALTAIDLDVMRLPNKIVYPTLVAVLSGFAVAALATGRLEPLLRAVVAGGAVGLFFLALALAKPGGMGLGDVRLSVVIGAVLGYVSWPAVVVGVFAAFVVGAVVGVAMVVARRAGRSTLVPFGPALVAGAFIAFFASAWVAETYSSMTIAFSHTTL